MNLKLFSKIISSAVITFLSVHIADGQDIYQRNSSADIQHYDFGLTLNDANNKIVGNTVVTVSFENTVEPFTLDLVKKSGEYGMEIQYMLEGKSNASFTYLDDKIRITPSTTGPKSRTYTIAYEGIAESGLVIDTTKFGQRSFFGDNWPNLARHWLPCVDHPYDKATIEFRITAPDHYDVLATGKKIEESHLGNKTKLTRYHEPAPVAMKVVTIGVTKFASTLLDVVQDIPVTAWVYPENRTDGFSDYKVATNVMEYYIKNIGPYPYAKLANMQAKTRWGGLENAGTISYFENSVTGENKVEGLIAHEIAHQWFGNSATENSWNHVWLSEGFATYFTILYQEDVYGNEKRKEELELDRGQVIEYYKKNPSPIVDNTITDPLKVLSTNTYQKASWVLNMLRRQLGDDTFWDGIRAYYLTYRDSNVMTKDFRGIMEQVSGQDLEGFFQQWIFTKGYPELKWDWTYADGKIKFNLNQLQSHHTFKFPLELGIVSNNQMKLVNLKVDTKSQTFEIALDTEPEAILIDPESWLLYEAK